MALDWRWREDWGLVDDMMARRSFLGGGGSVCVVGGAVVVVLGFRELCAFVLLDVHTVCLSQTRKRKEVWSGCLR